MGDVVILLAIVVNFGLVLRRPRSGVLVFVVLAMILPHVSLAGTPIAYEILALPFVLAGTLLRRPKLSHPRFHLSLSLFLTLIILSTILSMMLHGGEFDVVRLQGIARFLILLSLCRELLDKMGIEQALLGVVGINAVVGSVQLVLPETAGMFFDLYGRPGQTVLERYALEGAIPRASGTFSSPVILGAVALTALSVAWARLLSPESDQRHRWLIVLAGIAGVVSLTKTFLLGAPLVLIVGLVLCPLATGTRSFGLRLRSTTKTLGVVLAAIGLSFLVGGYLNRLGLSVGYYLAYLADPRAALTTRYAPGGQLEETMMVIRDHPIFGVGMTNLQGEFLGDSSYLLLLHSTGFLGSILVMTGLYLIVLKIVRNRRYLDLLVVCALLIAGLALPFLFSLPGALGVAYVLSRYQFLRPGSFSKHTWNSLQSKRFAHG